MGQDDNIKNIFVVDDDPAIRSTLDLHLAEAGYKVTLCSNNGDFFDEMARHPFDILITNIGMPEISDSTNAADPEDSRNRAPVILLTGRDEISGALHGMKEGAYDYLEKPITKEHLLATVQRAMVHRAVLERNTELEKVNLELREQTKALRVAEKVIACASDGIFVTDINGTIEFVNPAFTTITGFTPKEAIGQKPSILKSGRQSPEFYKDLWSTLRSTGHWEGEIWNRKKDGSIYPQFTFISAIRDSNGDITKSVSTIRNSDAPVTNYASFINDITKLKNDENEIYFHSNYDPLTRLPNRSLFEERLTHAISRMKREAQMMAVFFLDLDNFKKVNDAFGHNAGNLLLKEASTRLLAQLRESDTVSRLGGDEFAILLEDVTNEFEVKDIVDRLITSMSQSYMLDGCEVFVSASVGIALCPDAGETSEILIKNADIAMYHAKEKGKNRYDFFAEEMSARLVERLAIETGLRKAVQNNELVALYQPQVDSSSGRITGLEALMRWQRPGHGLVSPGEFISIAEESNLIVSMGEWILREACHELKRWHNKGYDDLVISVNVSAKQFEKQDLAETVQKVLDEADLLPTYLELEVTESAIMANVKWATKVMNEIHNLGVRISIDDFGTGYSSMSHLKNFPISKLKVDKSFIDDITSDSDNQAIVRATISMGQGMGLSVIAEGAETLEQVQVLHENGCPDIQGFFFSPPADAETVMGLLKEHNSKERSQKWACC